MNPKINIQFNKFLEPIFQVYIGTLKKPEGWVAPTKEEVDKGVEMYNEVWAEVGEKILTVMQEITGLSYTRNQIDVHIVSSNPRSFSSPIVMEARYTKDRFINILVEELTHCLMKDNLVIVNNHKAWIEIKNKYTGSTSLLNHIMVYSIMRETYKKIGMEFNLKLKESETNKEYIKARNIALKDSEQILQLFN